MVGLRSCCLLLAALAWSSCQIPGAYTLRDQRVAINKACGETLKELYSRRPEARADIEAAPGYAMFCHGRVKTALPVGRGYGVAVDNSTGKRTFMRVAELGAGTAFRLEEFRAVFVFDTKDTMREFVDSGWQFGAKTETATEARENTVRVYRVTGAGVSLESTINGTRYWTDRGLNYRGRF